MSRIVDIVLDDAGLPPPTPEIEQERRVAMFDLLEENTFVLPPREGRQVPDGPYKLNLSIREKRLVFDVETEGEGLTARRLGPARPERKRREERPHPGPSPSGARAPMAIADNSRSSLRRIAAS